MLKLTDEQVGEILAKPIKTIKEAEAAVTAFLPAAVKKEPKKMVEPPTEEQQKVMLSESIKSQLRANENLFGRFRESRDVKYLKEIFYDFQRFLRRKSQ